jgi:hypothetical protein
MSTGAFAGEDLAGHMLATTTEKPGDGDLFDARIVRCEQRGEFVPVPFRGLYFEAAPAGVERAEFRVDRVVVGCCHGFILSHRVTIVCRTRGVLTT